MRGFNDLLRQKPCSLFIFGVELNLSCIPDDAVHVSGLGGEDGGVLLLDAVPQVYTMLRHG
jgi:hypothetical protein